MSGNFITEIIFNAQTQPEKLNVGYNNLISLPVFATNALQEAVFIPNPYKNKVPEEMINKLEQ